MFCRKSTAVYSGYFVRASLIYAQCSLGFSSQIYVWVNSKGSVKWFDVWFAARLAKFRRFCQRLAVNRFSFAVGGWYKNYYLRFFFTVAKFRIVSDYLVLQFLQSAFGVHLLFSPVVLKYRAFQNLCGFLR